jgi:large subunit ribosomal protein L2
MVVKNDIFYIQKFTLVTHFIGFNSPLKCWKYLPQNSFRYVDNIELFLIGGQLFERAGTSAKLLAKEGDYITLRLPSKKLINWKEMFCHNWKVIIMMMIKVEKLKNTLLGKRPTVRGSVMNPWSPTWCGGRKSSIAGVSFNSR